jgi:hypothetical protein
MGWLISRQEAAAQPEQARRKVLDLLANLDTIPDPEPLLLQLMVDAILLVEAYRGARHQVLRLPELERSVDAILRELEVSQRITRWSDEPVPAAG